MAGRGLPGLKSSSETRFMLPRDVVMPVRTGGGNESGAAPNGADDVVTCTFTPAVESIHVANNTDLALGGSATNREIYVSHLVTAAAGEYDELLAVLRPGESITFSCAAAVLYLNFSGACAANQFIVYGLRGGEHN